MAVTHPSAAVSPGQELVAGLELADVDRVPGRAVVIAPGDSPGAKALEGLESPTGQGEQPAGLETLPQAPQQSGAPGEPRNVVEHPEQRDQGVGSGRKRFAGLHQIRADELDLGEGEGARTRAREQRLARIDSGVADVTGFPVVGQEGAEPAVAAAHV